MGSNPIPSANPLSRSLLRLSFKRVALVAVLTASVGAAVALIEGWQASESVPVAETESRPAVSSSANPALPVESVVAPPSGGLTIRLLDHDTAP